MRDGVGAGEDRRGLAVLAVRVGEEERLGGREALVHDAALADEAAFKRRAVVDAGALGDDEVVGLDVDADVHPVAECAVHERRGAVDFDVVADAHLADEAGAREAAVAAHLARLGRAGLGQSVDHRLERRNGLGAVAVDGHHVGDLRRHRVVDLHRAAAAFVHRRDADAVTEGAAVTALEGRDALDKRVLADAVVADARIDDAGAGGERYVSLQAARDELRGGEVGRDVDLRPLLGGGAEGLDGGNLFGG